MSAKPDNPDTTIKNLHDLPPLPEAAGPRRVGEAELVAWLTAQFQTWPDCGAVSVERVFRLEAPDSEGCNWSRTLVLDPHGVDPVVYVIPYGAIVEKARKAFLLD